MLPGAARLPWGIVQVNRLLLRTSRGIKTGVSDLRKGDWIEHDGKVFVVHQVNSSHSGRGSRQFALMVKDAVSEAFTTIKPSARDLFESNSGLSRQGSSDSLELEMQDVAFSYLYEADGLVYLLNSKTLEEINVPSKLVQRNLAKLLEGGAAVKVRMNGDQPLLVHPSVRNMKCTVAKVIDKTLSSDRKIVMVETVGGAKITCSTIVSEGDEILVNVDEMTYQGRAA